jgi:hypothetical protein
VQNYVTEWDALANIIKRAYGIHIDPTDSGRLCYIDTSGQRQVLCTLTYSIKRSDSHDFEVISEAIVRNKLEKYGIARQPGMRII